MQETVGEQEEDEQELIGLHGPAVIDAKALAELKKTSRATCLKYMISQEEGFADKKDVRTKIDITWQRGCKTRTKHAKLLDKLLKWAEASIAARHLSTLGVHDCVRNGKW